MELGSIILLHMEIIKLSYFAKRKQNVFFPAVKVFEDMLSIILTL